MRSPVSLKPASIYFSAQVGAQIVVALLAFWLKDAQARKLVQADTIVEESPTGDEVAPEAAPTSSEEDDDDVPAWIRTIMYIMIPIVSALVGWGTNVLALWMTQYPTEFFPPFLAWSQLPDQPIGLGWQGIIPSKAEKMSLTMTKLMTERLINIEELIKNLVPEELAIELKPGLEKTMTKIVDKVAMNQAPDVWESTPDYVKAEVVVLALEHSVDFTAGLIDKLAKNFYDYFDIFGMVVRLAAENRDTITKIFQEVGASEFTFIERSGAYFGFVFGLVQALIYAFYDEPWVLPFFGLIVGYATNWLALLLIFQPQEPRSFCGYSFQGVFLKRQHEASATFARTVTQVLLTSENMWDEILHGRLHHEWEAMLRDHIKTFFDQVLGPKKFLVTGLLGREKWEAARALFTEEVIAQFSDIIPYGYKYTEQKLNLEQELTTRLRSLPPADFEGVLHPAFEEDEIKLILVGALLGALLGALQEFVVFFYLHKYAM